MDIATLGLAIDSRSVPKATSALDKFTMSGVKAERAANRVSKASTGISTSMRTAVRGLAAMTAGMVSFAAAGRAITSARGFQAALAETSTLIEGTASEMAMLNAESKRLAATYGGSATGQVKAFYQAISAGADGVTGATQLLDQANKLAIGGVTDITTAVNGLTVATNAYAAQGLTAAQASDALFVGMKAGKTTISELSAALGQVVPLASAAGVSFDEVVAATSALTTQGQTTSMAVTGLRQVIASVIKPTKQASDMADQLGISFNAGALESKGLAGFLDEVIVATGGNTESMAQLFGSVEALNAALAFAGGAGKTFTEIMDQMEQKAGATDAAFGKLSKGMDQRLNVVMGKLGVLAINFGNALLTAAVPAMEAFAAIMETVANNMDVLKAGLIATAIVMTSAFMPAIIAGTVALGRFVAGLVLTRGALIATGIGALIVGVGTLVFWFDKLVTATGGWGNALNLLGLVAKGVWEGIKTSASALGPALGAVWETIKGGFLTMLSYLTEKWAAFLNLMANGADYLPMFEGVTESLRAAADKASASVQEYDDRVKSAETSSALLRSRTRQLALSGFDMARGYLKRLEQAMAKSNTEMEDGESAAKDLKAALDGLNEELGGKGTAGGARDAKEAVTELADEMNGPLSGAVDSISNAFGDFLTGSLRTFGDFKNAIVNSFKRMIAQMISIAVKNKIVIGLGLGGSVAGSAASATTGGAGGGGGIGGGLLGSLGGKLIGGITSGVGLGLSSLFGAGGGIGSYLGTIGAQFGAAATGSIAAIGGLVGVLGPLALGIGLLVKGLSREYYGSAIRGNLGSDGFQGTSFDFYKGGFLRGDKTTYSSVPDEIQTLLDLTMFGLRGSVEDMADILGLGSKALDGFVGDQFTIWTNGKTAEQIQEALTKQITLTGEAMADLILGTDKYTRVGESSLETLTRLSTSLVSVNDAMDLLGQKLFVTSLKAGDAASTLVDAFGGLDTMNAAITFYFANFYSEAERFDTTTRRLNGAFADLGVAMPQSRDQFRDLVESVDKTTTSGAKLYAELILMSGALSEVLPQVSAFTLGMQGLLDSIGGEIGSLIDNARVNMQDSKTLANLWYKTATTLRDFLASLLNTNLSAASPSQTRAVNRNRFNTAFDLAKGGDVQAARDIPGLAKAFLSSELANASTALEYRKIASQVSGQVNFLAGLSELQGANEDVLVTLYNKQIDVLTSLGNFLQLEGLTGTQIDNLDAGIKSMVKDWDGTVDSFTGALGGLQTAIEQAEAFSYDDLVGRLDVAVALSDNSPKWLRKLVQAADNDISTTLDLIIRDDSIDPAMRWLAVDSISEQIKTINFVLNNDIGKTATKLALATSSELRRNIRLIVKQDLPDDVKRIALMGNLELSRVVNVSLDEAGSDPRALRIALSNIGQYAANVTATLDTPSMSDRVKRIILRQQGGYAAMIEAGVGLVKSDPVAARILLRQQGRYTATIGAIISERMGDQKKSLLMNAVTNAVRMVTISEVNADGLESWQKRLLTSTSRAINRTINAAMNTGKIGSRGQKFLDELSGSRVDRTIKALMNTGAIGDRGQDFLDKLEPLNPTDRTIKGIVDLSGLTDRQKSLLDAITDTTGGKLTLGGSFKFSPSEAFSVLFSDATHGFNSVKDPMNRLTGMLESLTAKVAEDTAQREKQSELMRVVTQGGQAADRLASRQSNATGLIGKIRGLEASTGISIGNNEGTSVLSISKNGKIQYNGDWTTGGPGLAAFNKAFRGKGGLESKIGLYNSRIGDSMSRLTSLRQQVRALGGIPAFASGGLHSGGLRIVGERGPELERTGPSRIYSNSQTRQMFDTSGMEAEMRAMRKELAGFRDQSRQLDMQTVRNTRVIADLAEKDDVIGIPVTRT